MKISSRDLTYKYKPVIRQDVNMEPIALKPQPKNKEVYRKDVLANALKNLWEERKK
jgi:hypothetical protein